MPWTTQLAWWPHTGLTPAWKHLSFLGETRTGHRALDVVSAVLGGGQSSLPLHSCYYSPGCGCLTSLQRDIADPYSVWAQYPPDFLSKDAFSLYLHPVKVCLNSSLSLQHTISPIQRHLLRVQLMFHRFSYGIWWQTISKARHLVKVYNIHCCPFTHRSGKLVGQLWFGKSKFVVPNICFVLDMLGNGFQGHLFHKLPRNRGVPRHVVVPQIFLLTLQDGCDVCLF